MARASVTTGANAGGTRLQASACVCVWVRKGWRVNKRKKGRCSSTHKRRHTGVSSAPQATHVAHGALHDAACIGQHDGGDALVVGMREGGRGGVASQRSPPPPTSRPLSLFAWPGGPGQSPRLPVVLGSEAVVSVLCRGQPGGFAKNHAKKPPLFPFLSPRHTPAARRWRRAQT